MGKYNNRCLNHYLIVKLNTKASQGCDSSIKSQTGIVSCDQVLTFCGKYE